MFFDPMYLLFIAPAFLFSLWTSWRTKANYRKYSRVPVSSGLSGAQAARLISSANHPVIHGSWVS